MSKKKEKYTYYTFVGFYWNHSTRPQDWYKTLFYVDATAFTFLEAKKEAKDKLRGNYLKACKGYWTFSNFYRNESRLKKVFN